MIDIQHLYTVRDNFTIVHIDKLVCRADALVWRTLSLLKTFCVSLLTFLSLFLVSVCHRTRLKFNALVTPT